MNINFKHLYYFQVVAEEGSITRAAERLHLAPQTISAQLGLLEESLGTRLLRRAGRHWVVTDSGAVALQYATDIFRMGKELTDVLRGTGVDKPVEMVVGITDAIPKTMAYKLIEPALNGIPNLRLQCYEGPFDDLMAKLAVHTLDVVIADRPFGQQMHVKAHNQLLHQSDMSFLVAESLLPSEPFPQCLERMPVLLPSEHHWSSKALMHWFEKHKVTPLIRGRFDDTALMKTFAKAGTGGCFIPTLIEQQVAEEFDLIPCGKLKDLRESYYAITVERKITHPGVKLICDTE